MDAFEVVKPNNGLLEVEKSITDLTGVLSGIDDTLRGFITSYGQVMNGLSHNILLLTSGINTICEAVDNLYAILGEMEFSGISDELGNATTAINNFNQQFKDNQSQDLWMGIWESSVATAQLGLDLFKAKSDSMGKYNYRGYFERRGRYEKTSSNKSSVGMGAMAFVSGGVGGTNGGILNSLSELTKMFNASAAAMWLQNAATVAWQAICTAATAVTTAFGAAVHFLTSPIGLVILAVGALIAVVVLLVKNWDSVKTSMANAWEGIKAVWGTVAEWFRTHVAEPIGNVFKGIVNGVIWGINGYVGVLAKVINTIIGLINKIKIDVPDWVPGIGGETLGFNIPTITPPQIPYLAQGAVLPANEPFMAVVGDQKHGTNVEAPLATIQEAVANVMADMLPAMVAGFEAVVTEQRALRGAVEELEIGDQVIGQAAQRYAQRMAVIRGGAV